MPVVFKYNGYRFFFYSNEGATGTRPYSRQERRICGKILDTAPDKRCRGLYRFAIDSVQYRIQIRMIAKIKQSGFLHTRNLGKIDNIVSNQWRIGIIPIFH